MVSSEKTATINVSNGMLSYWPPLDEASLATDDLSAEEHQFLAGFTIDPTTGHATQSFDPIDTNIGGSQAELTAEQNARYWANKLAWLLRQVFGIVPDCKTNQTAERYNDGVSEDDLVCSISAMIILPRTALCISVQIVVIRAIFFQILTIQILQLSQKHL